MIEWYIQMIKQFNSSKYLTFYAQKSWFWQEFVGNFFIFQHVQQLLKLFRKFNIFRSILTMHFKDCNKNSMSKSFQIYLIFWTILTLVGCGESARKMLKFHIKIMCFVHQISDILMNWMSSCNMLFYWCNVLFARLSDDGLLSLLWSVVMLSWLNWIDLSYSCIIKLRKSKMASETRFRQGIWRVYIFKSNIFAARVCLPKPFLLMILFMIVQILCRVAYILLFFFFVILSLGDLIYYNLKVCSNYVKITSRLRKHNYKRL